MHPKYFGKDGKPYPGIREAVKKGLLDPAALLLLLGPSLRPSILAWLKRKAAKA